MKFFMMIFLMVVLSGCVTATYKDGEGESFKITSIFKSVEGLNAFRKSGEFSLSVDSTNSQLRDTVDLLRALDKITEDSK